VPDLALPLADLLPQSPGPYVVLMLAGFGIGIFGHLIKAKWLIVSGVILICLGALLLPLAVRLTSDHLPRPPAEQSRGDAG
jgi:hypothetical protein